MVERCGKGGVEVRYSLYIVGPLPQILGVWWRLIPVILVGACVVEVD